MATSSDNLDRKRAPGASAVRPSIAAIQQHAPGTPTSPHTPQRTFSSNFSSPAVSYRAEEDSVVFEFGSRCLRAGFAGESAPRCTLGFGPEASRRIGDYRQWSPEYETRKRKKRRSEDWGKDYELWQMDIRNVDLGLVEDKIERAVREVYSRYLLLDSKSRKLLLIVPSLMPRALLSTMISTLFNNFQMSSITVLPGPSMALAGAGVRSGLVVDIGWHETIITGIYEYREVLQRRTSRAVRLLTLGMAKLLEQKLQDHPIQNQKQTAVHLNYAEEVTTRLAWCQSFRDVGTLAGLDLENGMKALRVHESDPPISLSLPIPTFPAITLPFSTFSQPVSDTFLCPHNPSHELDDEEQPLPTLIYSTLLSLPADVRSLCMSRIIITGGGSRIPGLKSRLLDEVSSLIEAKGWDPVTGKAADERRRRLKKIHANRQNPATPLVKRGGEPETIPAYLEPQVSDAIASKILTVEMKGTKPIASGVIRGLETLGAWAGGSLIANLRIRGIVEIEREVFLQRGFEWGARKRDSGGGTIVSVEGRTGVAVGGWTLGLWA